MMLRAKVALFLALTLAMFSLMRSIFTLPRIPNHLRLIQETIQFNKSQEEDHTSTDRRSGIINLINDTSYEGVSNMTDFEKRNPLEEAIEESSIAELRQTTLAAASSIPPNNKTSEELPSLSIVKPFNQTFNSKRRKPSLANNLSNSQVSSYYFVNRIMTTRETVKPSCHRSCVDFRNRIYYSPPVGDPGAGLIDRLTIFGTLLNMAGYLCARVYVPRPKFLLGARHNSNQTVDASMSWSEFGDFVLWNDPKRQPALKDWDNVDDLNEWPIPESLLNMTTDLLLYSVRPRQVKFDFPTLENYTLAQQSRLKRKRRAGIFVWSIRAEYFEWGDMLANTLRKRPLPKQYKRRISKLPAPTIFAENEYRGCQYAKVGLTRNIRTLHEMIVGKIMQQQPESFSQSSMPPLVGYLHLRRKDARNACQTILWRVSAYLDCSLSDVIMRMSYFSSLERRGESRQGIVILFSSDDDDPHYRSQILQAIEKEHTPPFNGTNNIINVTAIDFDELVERTIRMGIQSGTIPARQLNKFHIFQLILSIGYNQSLVKFHLERRRKGLCEACANVTDQLIKSGFFGIDGYPVAYALTSSQT